MDTKTKKIKVPNYKELELKYLVLDYNGTLASSGKVANKTKELLKKVAEIFDIFVITADTFGSVEKELLKLPLKIVIISSENGTQEKEELITKLGYMNCVAIGNGNNDELMLRKAELGICLLGDEGCTIGTLMASDLVVTDINKALLLFLDSKKLVATLRK